MAAVPRDALQSVTIADKDKREILGAVDGTSKGVKKLMTAIERERNGMAERSTKKEACAAYTVILSS